MVNRNFTFIQFWKLFPTPLLIGPPRLFHFGHFFLPTHYLNSTFIRDFSVLKQVDINLPNRFSTPGLANSLIEIFWSYLTFKQQSSWIYCSAGNPVLLLSRPEYSEVALECLQSGKSGNLLLKCQICPKNFYQCSSAPWFQ